MRTPSPSTRRRLAALLLTGLACLAGCNGHGPIERVLHPGGEPALETAALEAVNEARIREGLPALTDTPQLRDLARLHSLDMARRGRLTHRGSDGREVDGRAARHGIDFAYIGENVGRNRGYHDPAAKAVLGWLASPGHRANILKPEYTHTGVGARRGEDGYVYFTQVFLRPLAP
jgi:uncharacterized protein YkwD